MDLEVAKHEKIRFRRDEIASLETLPSAEGQVLRPSRPALHRRALRVIAAVATVATSLVLVAAIAIYVIGSTGISTDSVRGEAEAAVEALAGIDVDARLGPARLSLDGTRLVAVEVNDVRFTGAADGVTILEAGSVRFGVRMVPLVSGNIRLGSASISDARILAGSMGSGGDSDWTAGFVNADGLADPDRITAGIFAAIHRALDVLATGSTRAIDLSNVQVVLPEGGALRSLNIVQASITQPAAGELHLSIEADIDGRMLSLEGTARRDTASKRITALELDMTSPAPDGSSTGDASSPEVSTVIGAIDARISGAEGIAGEAGRLTAGLELGDSVLDLGRGDSVTGTISLAATMEEGTGKIEINKGRINSDRNRVEFHGAMGPKPRSEGSAELPSYRYEFVSDGSTIAPADSQEPAVDILARLAGRYEAETRKLFIDDFGVRTQGGELLGAATFEFVPGKSPGISMAVTVPAMPATHVKQLWPWIAARGARRWALGNLFGGEVTNSSLQYRVVPGRIGNGIPLSAEEVSGKFNIAGARFDVTGRIPPVRDAVGSIEFGGNDVDVTLSAGSVYMPSGRSVAASNGKFHIHSAHLKQVVGDLDIDIAGEAPAVAELASYEPIDAMRFIGTDADDFSGEVSGNVKAEIPLFGNVDPKELGWLVALDYTNMTVDKPFDGQMVSDADGTIVVDPDKAVIAAKGKLNGAPAEINLVQPLGDSKVEPSRKITVTLDDKAREEMVPGLGELIDGKVKVSYSAGKGTAQRIEADLTDAKLDIGWVGWEKGAGIAGKAVFDLVRNGANSTLENFKLSGKSFSVAGEIELAGSALASARFDNARLNRGDDVRVSIKRSGKGYAIDVSGDALDARALIKQFTSDAGGGSGKAKDATPIKLDASVKSLTGFHSEKLSSVKLSYSGAGSRVDSLAVTATSSAGGAISVRNSTADGQKTMEMQSSDAGSILRFLDIYEHMEGGTIRLSMAGAGKGAMRGQVDARNFFVVNEPKLASIVSTRAAGAERSLNDAVRRDIDTSRVQFERGFTAIEKGDGYLAVDRGVLRGPLIGLIFQGTLYDKAGNMDMTGTFMPAYGLNRLFAELPLVGMILGNGSDRGLIGVTFRLAGDANKPALQINPLSAIAPGIFRSIFEFR